MLEEGKWIPTWGRESPWGDLPFAESLLPCQSHVTTAPWGQGQAALSHPTPEGSRTHWPMLLTSVHRAGSLQGASGGIALGLMPSRKCYSGGCHRRDSYSTLAKGVWKCSYDGTIQPALCSFFTNYPLSPWLWSRLYTFLRRAGTSNWGSNCTLHLFLSVTFLRQWETASVYPQYVHLFVNPSIGVTSFQDYWTVFMVILKINLYIYMSIHQ